MIPREAKKKFTEDRLRKVVEAPYTLRHDLHSTPQSVHEV